MLDPMIIPVEIRHDYFVQIMGIPHDLTPEEARKIASVILAYAPGPYRIELDPNSLLVKGQAEVGRLT